MDQTKNSKYCFISYWSMCFWLVGDYWCYKKRIKHHDWQLSLVGGHRRPSLFCRGWIRQTQGSLFVWGYRDLSPQQLASLRHEMQLLIERNVYLWIMSLEVCEAETVCHVVWEKTDCIHCWFVILKYVPKQTPILSVLSGAEAVGDKSTLIQCVCLTWNTSLFPLQLLTFQAEAWRQFLIQMTLFITVINRKM